MFGEIQSTPFDLRFHLFAIPVIVSPWFWLAALLGGWHPDHFSLVAIWVGCFFVSILLHEMGHALTIRSFGWRPQVYLYQFGGLAVFQPGYGYTTARSVLISFAGPGAGFVLFGLVLLCQLALGVPRHPNWIFGREILPSAWFMTLDESSQYRLLYFFGQMEWINLWWGLVNLLPVLPLDGGRIAEALLHRVRPWDGPAIAVKLSIAISGAAALYFLSKRQEMGTFPALFFGILCVSNLQSLQHRGTW